MKDLEINFDEFLMEKWLPEDMKHEEKTEELRKTACKNLWKTIKDEKVISRKKIVGKWFGLDEYACPNREQVIKLAFAAHFTVDTLQEYLEEGILEPALQINDYREMIFLYGLEHNCSYQECLDMIVVFERHVNQDTVIMQKTHTEKLKQVYNANSFAEREEFLLWMCSHAEYFKGYSRVILNHFKELKKEIIGYIRENAKEDLKKELKRLEYYEWAYGEKLEEDNKDNIQKYIRKISRRKNGDIHIKDDERKVISNLIRIAYMDKQTNLNFLRDTYQTFPKSRSSFNMDETTLSLILNVAEHKEKEIKLSWAYSCLCGIEDKKAACPQWICEMMERYGYKASQTVGETEAELKRRLRKQKQYCRFVTRNDLLLMSHVVSYMRYEKRENYNKQEEKATFIRYTNKILADCQMAELNEKYQMDYILLSAYKDMGMSSFAELVEGLGID